MANIPVAELGKYLDRHQETASSDESRAIPINIDASQARRTQYRSRSSSSDNLSHSMPSDYKFQELMQYRSRLSGWSPDSGSSSAMSTNASGSRGGRRGSHQDVGRGGHAPSSGSRAYGGSLPRHTNAPQPRRSISSPYSSSPYSPAAGSLPNRISIPPPALGATLFAPDPTQSSAPLHSVEPANNKPMSKKARKRAARAAYKKKQQQLAAQGGGAAASPSRKLTKAERRAIQERQRAEKAARQGNKKQGGSSKGSHSRTASGDVEAAQRLPTPARKNSARRGSRAPVMMQFDDAKRVAKFDRKRILERHKVQKEVSLFSHLPQYERETSLSLQVGFRPAEDIHPAILRLGLRYADGSIVGSNSRCVALLSAFKQVVKDYRTPEKKELSRDLINRLKPVIRFLIDCRPMSISMGNAIRAFKSEVARLPPEWSEEQAKAHLIKSLDDYGQERIEFADEVIASYGAKKIQDEDVIMTYACSSVVERVLKKAHSDGKRFRVYVVDSRPKFEGKTFLRRLVEHGIECSYIFVNAVSYVIKQVDKVFLGASSLLANGSAISRVGTAVVAMVAQTFKVPVMVCVETYKFHQRAQLESLSFNELGDPDDLISVDADLGAAALTDWRDISNLKLLNLVYDLTPTKYISMVITEVGMIPPTSVPVIIREYHKNMQA